MRVLWSILIFSLLSNTAFSQSAIEFDGYIVNVPALVWLNNVMASIQRTDQNCWTDVTRLRLRPTVNLSETGYITLEYEVSAVYQSDMLPLISSSNNRRQLVDLSWDIIDKNNWNVIHNIDRFYFRQQIGDMDFSIGRQRIAWGSGRIWNPTDLFNPLNPAIFSKIERDGVDAAVMKINLSSLSDITLVYNPRHELQCNYAVRIRTNINEFDISGIAGYFDQRVVLGSDIAGNLLEAGIRSEMILSMKKDELSKNFIKAIIGIDYQWTAEFYTLLEYHYNGEGKNDPIKYDLRRLLSGEVINVGVDYLALSASYLIHPLVMALITYNGNLNDGSSFFLLSAVYNPADEISITLATQLFAGDLLDEYWYYPNSCYVKAELFF